MAQEYDLHLTESQMGDIASVCYNLKSVRVVAEVKLSEDGTKEETRQVELTEEDLRRFAEQKTYEQYEYLLTCEAGKLQVGY